MKLALLCPIFFALAFAALVGTQTKPAPADATDPASRSGGFLNGRGWRALSVEMRIAFLFGYRDGLALGPGTTGLSRTLAKAQDFTSYAGLPKGHAFSQME